MSLTPPRSDVVENNDDRGAIGACTITPALELHGVEGHDEGPQALVASSYDHTGTRPSPRLRVGWYVDAMSANAAPKTPRYEDLFDLPEHHVGQIVRGVLYSHRRPALPHAVASSELGGDLGQKFGRGRGGPGGWIIVHEPEFHLANDVLVPDLAGFRRERMAEVPRAAYFTIAPDWVCEVLSPSTARLDRGAKREVYAREHVPYLWFVDPEAKTLEVLRLDGATYRVVQAFSDDAVVRAEPFDAVELELAFLWVK